MKKQVLLIVCFTLICNTMFGQISQGGIPESFKVNLKSTDSSYVKLSELVPTIQTSGVTQLQIDSIISENEKGDKVFQFAYGFQVDINIKDLSVIDSIENGLLYRIGIKSAGAYSINLILKKYSVPPGAKLYIYNKDQTDLKGAFTSNNNKVSEILPIVPVKGEEIIVEYFEPYFINNKGTVIIGKISHDFLDILNLNKANDFGNSGDCNVDINCPAGSNWQNDKRAVCKIIIDGSGLCSGTLLNNTTADGTPYFLTANHCIDNQTDAENSVFIFNYESPSCSGNDGSESQSISGADLRANRSQSDFSLLELSKIPISTYNPFYAGWDNQDLIKNNVIGIHHPMGDVKKICVENANIQSTDYSSDIIDITANHWRIENWDVGVTEGGSSGSALFDNNHRIIGQLHGGDAACDGNTDNNLSDWYGKISTSWDEGENQTERLRDWLDPANTVTVLNGSGICNQGTALNLNITHTITSGSIELHQAINRIEASNTIEAGATATYEAGNEIVLLPGFTAEEGSNFTARIVPMNCVLGCFPISIDLLTNAFTPNGDGINDQLCYPVSNATSYEFEAYNIWGDLIHSSSGPVTGNMVCVWDGSGSCSPCSYAVIITFRSDCDEKSEVLVVTVIGGSKSMQQSDLTDSINIEDKILLSIVPEKEPNSFDFEIFPNPSDGIFTLNVKSTNPNPYKFEIFNSVGELVYAVNKLNVNEIKINKSCLPSGIYYLRLNDGNSVVTKKLIVQ